MTKARKDYKASTYGETVISISRNEFLPNDISLIISIQEGSGMPNDKVCLLWVSAAALADKVEFFKVCKKMEVKLLKLISEKPDKSTQIYYEFPVWELTPLDS